MRNKECKCMEYRQLLHEILECANICNHHGREVMDSCKFRETFSELCKAIIEKIKVIEE